MAPERLRGRQYGRPSDIEPRLLDLAAVHGRWMSLRW
jgi:hypothetical protein